MAGRGSGGVIRRAILGAALGLLAGCAGPASPGACQVELAGTLPMVPGSHLVVEGRLAGRTVRFLLDTGAQVSSLTKSAAAAAGLRASGHEPAVVTGITGTVLAPMVLAPLEFGATREERAMPVLPDLPGQGGNGQEISGLLGIDLLANFDLEIAFDERVVRLWRAGSCQEDYVPWKEPHVAVPVRRTPRGWLVTTVKINEQDVLALIDTGANLSLLDAKAAMRAGASPEALAADPSLQTLGADGSQAFVRRHRFDTVQVGPDTLRRTPLTVTPRLAVGTDMLLGLDWMRRHTVWISARNWMMFVRPRARPNTRPVLTPAAPAAVPALPDAAGGRRA